jgi:hypothetical protein
VTSVPQETYAELEEGRIQHLEMIQAVISRLSNEGFLVKGWAITVAGVFFGFAVSSESWPLAAISLVPTVAFWYLDATFLRSERLFRALHSHVQRRTGKVEAFDMSATRPAFVAIASVDPGDRVDSLWAALKRPAICGLYGTLAVSALALIVVLVIAGTSEPPVLPVHLTR